MKDLVILLGSQHLAVNFYCYSHKEIDYDGISEYYGVDILPQWLITNGGMLIVNGDINIGESIN